MKLISFFILVCVSSPASIIEDYIDLQPTDYCFREIKNTVVRKQTFSHAYKIEVDAKYGASYRVTVSTYLPFVEFQRISYGVFYFDAHTCDVQDPHKMESTIRRLARR